MKVSQKVHNYSEHNGEQGNKKQKKDSSLATASEAISS